MSLSSSESLGGSTGSIQTPHGRPSDGNRKNGLFPLPLAPFERFLVFDEAVDCPITSFIELHFSSALDRKVLQDALHQTVHQHPLLASRLIEIAGKLHWQYDPQFVPELLDPKDQSILTVESEAPSAGTISQGRPRRIDLFSEPGCRYWYEERSQGKSRLMIQLHHAACDGVGLRRVLIDTLSSYAKETTPEPMLDPEYDSPKMVKRRKREEPIFDRLADRADFSAVTSRPAAVKMSAWQKLRNAYYFHFQRPRPLLTSNRRAVPCSPEMNNEPLRHHIFDEATSSRLLQCCRKNKVSLNDLALTILFRACSHWNRLGGLEKPGTRIRLLMPFDLRGRSDLQMPATNRLSFSFLGRTHEQCEDWPSLLEGVQEETEWIKVTRVYMDFLAGLTGLASHPRWMKRILHSKLSQNMSTSVLTYTGDIARGMKNYFPEVDGRRRIGDTYLENILIAPPTRRGTNVTLGLCINWGQICISANWNRNDWTAEDCEAFLQIYSDAMMEWLETMTHEG